MSHLPPPLYKNTPLYQKSFETYLRLSPYRTNLITWLNGNFAAKAENISLCETRKLKILSVGAGNGELDSNVFPLLRKACKPAEIQAVIVEPDPDYVRKYQDLVEEKLARLENIKFDWHQQTFQEYTDAVKTGDKFNFIGCFSCIHFLGDLDKSLPYLFDSLDEGGLLLVTTSPDTTGWAQVHHFLGAKTGRNIDYITAGSVQDVCQNFASKIETEIVESYVDISGCFQPLGQLSDDSRDLLSFYTKIDNFAEDTPDPLRSEVMEFLRSVAMQGKGKYGELALEDSSAVIFIWRL